MNLHRIHKDQNYRLSIKQKSLSLMWFLILFIYALNVSTLIGQQIINSSSYHAPDWTVEPPTGKYYTYYTAIGVSESSLAAAQKQAITNILSSIIMERSVLVQSELLTSISEKSETLHGKTETSIVDAAIQEVIAKGESSRIENLTKEEEYWQVVSKGDNLVYEYWILMKIPKPEFASLDLSVEQGYGITPIWKSAIVPGWGQFHKGESKKGWRFLISETIFTSSFFISNYFSHNYSSKAENERDYDRRKFYNDWSNRSYTVSTISGIIAGAIYAYNIFDSITSKGSKKYAHIQTKPLKIFANVNHKQAKIIIFINL